MLVLKRQVFSRAHAQFSTVDYLRAHRLTGAGEIQQWTRQRQAETCKTAVLRPTWTLQLHSELVEGSEGLVMLGNVDGIAAVVKLLGPDEQGMSAYLREVTVLRLMGSMAGQAVPQLLCAGHTGYAGVHFIATALIEGQALSELQHVPDGVATAAMATLDRIHEFDPTFLHGDIRLANIMLCQDSAPARCVFLDFGRSSLTGDAARQQAEKFTLKQLLQR
jgi:serine/threonine protein kinase